MNSLGDFLIWTVEVFFLVLAFWIFIAIFADIFRRTDIHGIAKAGWILAIIVLPFLGSLIYIIARPKVTQADLQLLAQADAASNAVAKVVSRLSRMRYMPASPANTFSRTTPSAWSW